jgi:hypothetical protein
MTKNEEQKKKKTTRKKTVAPEQFLEAFNAVKKEGKAETRPIREKLGLPSAVSSNTKIHKAARKLEQEGKVKIVMEGRKWIFQEV